MASANLLIAYMMIPRPRGSPTQRRGFSFDDFRHAIGLKLFKRVYRMSERTFDLLASLLSAKLRSNGRLTAAAKLSVTIRDLAGGSFLDVAIVHEVADQTFYSVVSEVLLALEKVIRLHFPYRDERKLKSFSFGMSRKDRSPLRDCVGAIDGISMKIMKPPRG